MLTLLHTLVNSNSYYNRLFNANPPVEVSYQHQLPQSISKALQNATLLKKSLLAEASAQESAALALLDKLLDTVPITQLASLSATDLTRLAGLLAKSSVSIPDAFRVVMTTRSRHIDDDATSVTSSGSTFVDDDAAQAFKLLKLPLGSLLNGINVLDGNHAVSHVAYALSDIAFVYPTSASQGYLGHPAEQWASHGIKNALGQIPKTAHMDTRSGAGSAIHGALTTLAAATNGQSMVTAFTGSKSILTMVPNMYLIAQEHVPVVFHIGVQSFDDNLNIIRGDYSDVLVARETGFAFLGSNTAQEAHDMALMAHLAAIKSKSPFAHVLDGVHTAHELSKLNVASYDQIQQLLRDVTRDHVGLEVGPVADIVEEVMAKTANVLGRSYHVFDYIGPVDAKTVIVVFGPASSIAVDALQSVNQLAKIGLLIVRLYRPWSQKHFLAALPKSAQRIAIVEPVSVVSASGPLFLDVAASLRRWNGTRPALIEAKYGAVGNDFSPATFLHLIQQISVAIPPRFVDFTLDIPASSTVAPTSDSLREIIFWDNEETAVTSKILASVLGGCHNEIQHSAAFDAYKNIPVVESHLRVGGDKFLANYPIDTAEYIAVNDASLLKEYDILKASRINGATTVVLNASWSIDDLETKLPNDFRLNAAKLGIKFFTIDADTIAKELSLDRSGVQLLHQVIFFRTFDGTQQLLGSSTMEDAIIALYESRSKLISKTLRDIIAKVDTALTPIVLHPAWLILEPTDKDLPSHVSGTLRSTAFTQNAVAATTGSGSKFTNDEDSMVNSVYLWREAAWQLMFNEAYDSKQALAPPNEERSFLIRVTENRRLTPDSYDRNVFHLEFDTTGTGLEYDLGEALGIHGHNDPVEVEDFLAFYGLNANDIVVIPHHTKSKKATEPDQKTIAKGETRTVFQLFLQYLDIFGRPSKRFYQELSMHATDNTEKSKLEYIISPEGAAEFKRRVEETITHADLLREFPSAHPSLEALINMVPPIKPRHYSIASSMKMHPNSVHLLVVELNWDTPSGKRRIGQCTRYLKSLKPGSLVTASIKSSVMKLPPLDHQPVIMAGLGTGMAPFRAFIQERAFLRSQGREVGPMVLYFGSRNRSNEYLYGEELEAYHAGGLLTHLRLAFSRDQPHKIYIQHRMNEDSKLLHKYILDESHKGHFYLCGPTWPAGDVKDAIVKSIVENSELTETDANRIVNQLKEEERYILEVY